MLKKKDENVLMKSLLSDFFLSTGRSFIMVVRLRHQRYLFKDKQDNALAESLLLSVYMSYFFLLSRLCC